MCPVLSRLRPAVRDPGRSRWVSSIAGAGPGSIPRAAARPSETSSPTITRSMSSAVGVEPRALTETTSETTSKSWSSRELKNSSALGGSTEDRRTTRVSTWRVTSPDWPKAAIVSEKSAGTLSAKPSVRALAAISDRRHGADSGRADDEGEGTSDSPSDLTWDCRVDDRRKKPGFRLARRSVEGLGRLDDKPRSLHQRADRGEDGDDRRSRPWHLAERDDAGAFLASELGEFAVACHACEACAAANCFLGGRDDE